MLIKISAYTQSLIQSQFSLIPIMEQVFFKIHYYIFVLSKFIGKKQ